jgi:hypothetical protein
LAYDPTREQPLPRSLDDVRALLASLPAADEAAAAAVAAREA